MENQTQIVEAYCDEGLSRLNKEKLVTIVSNLCRMPVNVAMKVAENIPEYIRSCNDAIHSVVSFHRDILEYGEQDTKYVLDALESTKDVISKCLQEADTDEKKRYYLEKLEKVDKEIKTVQINREKELKDTQQSLLKAVISIIAFAGGAIGIGVKFGKRK